jgi:hypothetical protein
MTNSNEPANGTTKGAAERMIADAAPPAVSQATQFLELLGKDPATTRLRAFPHKESTNKAKIAARKGEWDLEQAATWNREGRGVFVVTGNGGDKKEDITSCPALFVEWDDQPIEWQLTAWIELGLPEPTMQVPTGGRSVHNWWVMTEPISPAEFEALQIRLYTHCKSDELKDPSRVMRLPGFAYIGPDDKPAGLVELVNVTGNRYSAADIEACLPAAAAPAKPGSKPKTKRSAVDLPPRSEADLLEALATRVPAFLPDESRRDELLNLAFRLWVEVGAARAEQILAKHSPAVTDLPSYFKGKAPTKISAGSIWPFLNEHYDVDLERHDLKRSAPAPAGKQQDKLTAATAPATSKATPDKPVTFEDRWQELEEHAAVVACSDWPVMKAVASLASKAGDLEVNRLTGRNLEQLLEQAHRAVRAKADPIAGGGTFKVKTTPWAVDGLFRHGLNLLVGQSGAGKSRLAAACMAAWLRGDQTWLNLPLNGIEPEHRHALIVGSDQTLEDWAITLEPVGLCKRLDAETVRIHPNLTLYGLETAVGLDVDGLAMIRRWVDHHPGGMVLVDSLSSCLPPGIDEATKAAGRPVRQLQEVLGDAWGILTHHTRKGAGKEGNLGVGAGRGSGDIDAAASRVIGLGLIYKMENGVLVPQESDDRRELLSTKRGGKTLHLVVKSDASGFWSNEGDAEALKQQERQERAISNLTEAQGDVLALLDAADGWMTLRALIEGAGEEYEARGAKAATTRKVLKRLEVLGLAESVKSGSERTYRAKGEPLRGKERELTGSLGSPTAPQGFSMAHPQAHTGSHEPGEPPTGSEPQGEPGEQLTPASEPQGEPVKSQSPQRVSQVSHPDLVELIPTTTRKENEQRIRDHGRSTDLTGWSDGDVAELLQSLEQAAIRRRSGGLLGQEVAA